MWKSARSFQKNQNLSTKLHLEPGLQITEHLWHICSGIQIQLIFKSAPYRTRFKFQHQLFGCFEIREKYRQERKSSDV